MNRLILDVDGVVANFADGLLAWADERGGYDSMPCCWRQVDEYVFFPRDFVKPIWSDESFWSGLRRMPGARSSMINFGIFPDMYLTSRPIRSEVTQDWLIRNLFPYAEVVTVDRPEDKIGYLREGDVFVDDLPKTVRQAQDAGVTALLMRAPFHRGCGREELEGLTSIQDLSYVSSYVGQN